MDRQLIMGSGLGIALGALLTASIAYGVFVPQPHAPRGSDAAAVTAPLHVGSPGVDATYATGNPPLRPGSHRVGPPVQATPAPEVPVALDARSTDEAPTV